jgi:excisionase family DNA binding protein
VSQDRLRADRPPPERLALGEASRLLGVDPDTLRRWADEGRVPAFTTPGGHRRTGPAGGLAGLGATPDRLSAAYRRRYGEPHGAGLDPRTFIPVEERESFRESGRRLVDALVRHLDESGQGRVLAEREAVVLSEELGERLAAHGVPMSDAVSMFVAARRPFLSELSIAARRRGVDAARIGQLYDASTSLLDRLLLAFVAAHAAVSGEGVVGEGLTGPAAARGGLG